MNEPEQKSKKLVLKKQKLRTLTNVELNAVAAASDPHGAPNNPTSRPPGGRAVMAEE
jgi:hypothetical protein